MVVLLVSREGSLAVNVLVLTLVIWAGTAVPRRSETSVPCVLGLCS